MLNLNLSILSIKI